jgi:hypothetical protein
MSSSIVETLKDTKQHWGNIGGHQVMSQKCQGTSEKEEFFVSFLKQQGTSRRHQMTTIVPNKCEGDIKQR